MPKSRWDILGQEQLAKVAVKRAARSPLFTGGLERSIVNHLQHTHVHNSLQELSNHVSDNSWDKAGIKTALAGLLVFPWRQGGSALGTETRAVLVLADLQSSESWSSDTGVSLESRLIKKNVWKRGLGRNNRLGHWFWKNQELYSYQLSPPHQVENSQLFPESQEIASKEGERNSLLTTCKLWSPVRHKNVNKDQSFFHETFFFLNRATPLGRTVRSCYLSHVLEVIKENEKYEKTHRSLRLLFRK